jgi:hypothetical protein
MRLKFNYRAGEIMTIIFEERPDVQMVISAMKRCRKNPNIYDVTKRIEALCNQRAIKYHQMHKDQERPEWDLIMNKAGIKTMKDVEKIMMEIERRRKMDGSR